MHMVYVQNKNGIPLMPTRKFGMVKHFLKEGKARVISTRPFTIRLTYEATCYTQPLYGGIDPGRSNIGVAVLNQKGECVYSAEVETRNREIPKLMAERRAHRQASRRGERQRRKRRAVKNNTIKEFPKGRKLPGYENGVLNVKDIINSEARFNNRKRPAKWLTPTARQCVQTHVSIVKNVCKILPVRIWTLEYNKFAFMKLEDGSISGVDFQNGRIKGFKSTEEYVANIQHGKCCLCGDEIEHYHHLIPKHKGGSDLPENLIGLCGRCHDRLHKNLLDKTERQKLKDLGFKKKYAGLSILNIAIPHI